MRAAKNPNVTPWTPQEVRRIVSYAKANSRELVSNMLTNIVIGFVRFRKPRWFFKLMAKEVGRPSTLCKSKFQNDEKKIYVEHLKVPEAHYILFRRTRKAKPARAKFDVQKLSSAVLDYPEEIDRVSEPYTQVQANPRETSRPEKNVKKSDPAKADREPTARRLERIRYLLYLGIRRKKVKLLGKYTRGCPADTGNF